MKIETIGELSCRILDEVATVIVGKRPVLEFLLTGLLANGHVLFEDFPGLAKTLTAKAFAATLGCRFKRVQFTPDLLPADIIGTYVYNQKTGDFNLRRGPIFTNILLADEINRSPPKTQAALLESMQERQVTIEGETFQLDRPFIVVATQNPIEYEGVYPLPEAQIDRFMMRLSIGYPTSGEEKEILDRRKARGREEVFVKQIVEPHIITEMQQAVEQVHVDDTIEEYIVDIVQRTRSHPMVELGASPRGSLAIWQMARARAAVQGRDYVVPDDVKDVAVNALSHRLLLKTGPWLSGAKAEEIVRGILLDTPAPPIP